MLHGAQVFFVESYGWMETHRGANSLEEPMSRLPISKESYVCIAVHSSARQPLREAQSVDGSEKSACMTRGLRVQATDVWEGQTVEKMQ